MFVHASANYFVCTLCSDSFRVPRYLQDHLQSEHHQEKPAYYECFVCHNPFSRFKSLKQHMDILHSSLANVKIMCPVKRAKTGKEEKKEKYDCFICHESFLTPGLFKQHIKTHTGKKFYSTSSSKQKKEDDMRRLLADDKTLKMNLATDHEFNRYKLELKQTLNFVKFIDTKESRLLVKFSLSDRSYERTIDRSFLCPFTFCGEKFKSTSHIRRHIFVHGTTNFFQCSLCSTKFRLQRYLYRHLKENHPDSLKESRSFECHLCHKPFTVIGRLVQHMSMHLWRKKYWTFRNTSKERKPQKPPNNCPRLCELCGRQLNSAKAMRDHRQIHEAGGTKLHVCTICNKSFSVPRYLLRHIRKYHK